MPSEWDERAIRADGHKAASDAAQFMPFAALRGLEQILAARSDELFATDKHELTQEEAWELSRFLERVQRGDAVWCDYYCRGFYRHLEGVLRQVCVPERYLLLDHWRIAFDDIRAMGCL